MDRLEDEERMRANFPKAGGIFSKDEIVELKGSRFRIVDISPFGLKLKLLRNG